MCLGSSSFKAGVGLDNYRCYSISCRLRLRLLLLSIFQLHSSQTSQTSQTSTFLESLSHLFRVPPSPTKMSSHRPTRPSAPRDPSMHAHMYEDLSYEDDQYLDSSSQGYRKGKR
jgi:hypothetical protein